MFRLTRALRANISLTPGVPHSKQPNLMEFPINLTTNRILTADGRLRYKWVPHPNLARCTNIDRLEYYLKCHHEKLRWLRSKIANERKTAPMRRIMRVNIGRHLKEVVYIEDKLHALKGTCRIPKLHPENAPTHTHDNPSIQSIVVTHRVPRSYDYPGKDKYEQLVEADNKRAKETHEVYKKAYQPIWESHKP